MKTFWDAHKAALLPVVNVTVRECLETPRKSWWTVGELAEECRNHGLSAEAENCFERYRFNHLTRRIQYQIVQKSLRTLKRRGLGSQHDAITIALGADDGREVRVYALSHRVDR